MKKIIIFFIFLLNFAVQWQDGQVNITSNIEAKAAFGIEDDDWDDDECLSFYCEEDPCETIDADFCLCLGYGCDPCEGLPEGSCLEVEVEGNQCELVPWMCESPPDPCDEADADWCECYGFGCGDDPDPPSDPCDADDADECKCFGICSGDKDEEKDQECVGEECNVCGGYILESLENPQLRSKPEKSECKICTCKKCRDCPCEIRVTNGNCVIGVILNALHMLGASSDYLTVSADLTAKGYIYTEGEGYVASNIESILGEYFDAVAAANTSELHSALNNSKLALGFEFGLNHAVMIFNYDYIPEKGFYYETCDPVNGNIMQRSSVNYPIIINGLKK